MSVPTSTSGGSRALQPSAFTLRAFILGSLLALLVAAGAPYGHFFLHGSFMAFGFSTVGAMFLLFVLAGVVNPLLGLLHRPAQLVRGELLLIYAMMVMASPVATLFTWQFITQITAPYYYAGPDNDWRETILPYLPEWLVPDPAAIAPFYEGLGRDQPVPWNAWLPTVAAWLPFIGAMFAVMIATTVILRRQWVEHERLIYPLVQVPLAMTEEGRPGTRLGPFFRNPVMWAGFLLPAVYGTLHGLHMYFPGTLPVAQDVDLVPPFYLHLFRDSTLLQFKLRFNIMGFFYFLKTEVAFSLWFFNLIAQMLRGIFGVLGITGGELLAGGGHSVDNKILAMHSLGAMLVLCLGGLWVGRRHLGAVWRKAVRNDAAVDDSDEILSYRAAVLLLVVGSAVMVAWLYLAGLPPGIGVLLLLLSGVLFVGFTRVVAEGGLSDGAPPVVPSSVLVTTVGSSAIGDPGLVVLATTYFWAANARTFVMASCANCLRLGEELGRRKRWMFAALVLALVVAVAGSFWMQLTLSYQDGNLNLAKWSQKHAYDYMGKFVRSAAPPYIWSWVHAGVGASIMSLLMLARWRFLWWPLHPLGYPIGAVWIMDQLWFNMFLAWLIKAVVLKYGGVSLYRRTQPFFMGLILGQIVPGGVFLFIDHVTGMRGNVIFWG